MKVFLTILFALVSLSVKAGDRGGVKLKFVPVFMGKPIEFELVYYKLHTGDSVLFETFRCYISAIELFKNGRQVFAEPNSFHLIDAGKPETCELVLDAARQTDFDEVRFNLGIDSATNVAGVMGGDLDPTKGMYWAWQSGYINLKLEGRCNLCKTRNNEFQFHLGGYMGETRAVAPVRIKAGGNSVSLNIPLDRLFEGLDLAAINSVMIPSKEAAALSKKIAGLIQLSEH